MPPERPKCHTWYAMWTAVYSWIWMNWCVSLAHMYYAKMSPVRNIWAHHVRLTKSKVQHETYGFFRPCDTIEWASMFFLCPCWTYVQYEFHGRRENQMFMLQLHISQAPERSWLVDDAIVFVRIHLIHESTKDLTLGLWFAQWNYTIKCFFVLIILLK